MANMMKSAWFDFDAKQIQIKQLPIPVPEAGEVLCKVLACGICGTDLHFLQHGSDMGMQPCVCGHEFVCEVVKKGPDTQTSAISPGDRVCSMPILPWKGQPDTPPVFIGGDPQKHGAYSEYMVLSAELCNKVPSHVSDDHAALTEPMAVAVHAVNACRGKPENTVPVVYGCGPVGLCGIMVLKARGFSPIIAVQRSAFRRGLAKHFGADIVLDPSEDNAMEVWSKCQAEKVGITLEEQKLLERGNYGHGGLNLVWEQVSDKWFPPVVFENIGVPNSIETIVNTVPRHTQVVVCGLCMVPDTVNHGIFMSKEVDLKYVLGYTGAEFTEALNMVASGKFDLQSLVTLKVGLDDVGKAFDILCKPSEQAKILVLPWLKTSAASL